MFNIHKSFLAMSMALCCLLLLAACGNGGTVTGANTTPTASKPGKSTPATGGQAKTSPTLSGQGKVEPTVSVTLPALAGVSAQQGCPPAVSATTYWDALARTQPGVSIVSNVTCASLTNNPATQQALVEVTFNNTPPTLDIHVYDNITSPNPTQIFSLLNLQQGAVKISPYRTLITAQVDPDSAINKNAGASPTPDLFREFKWSEQTGTFVPTAFPGIYPDLTRYQAEVDQQDVNQGHQPWKLDATQVALALAVNMLRWSSQAQPSIISGGGAQDRAAVVNVKSTSPGAGTITVSLSRLEGSTTGIWEVTSVETDGMAIKEPLALDRLSSPVTVVGKGNAFEARIGQVIVLDHLYSNIGQANADGAIGMGNTTFTANLTYTSSFKTGAQEGIVELVSPSQADGSIAGVVMLKELLG